MRPDTSTLKSRGRHCSQAVRKRNRRAIPLAALIAITPLLTGWLGGGTTEGVLPESNFATSGPAGGPIEPAVEFYTLTNGVESSVEWRAVHSASWLTVRPDRGRLPPGGSVEIAVAVNDTASLLPPGEYQNSVEFTWTTLRGDMNGDTRIDPRDVVLFSQVLAGEVIDTGLFRRADMNADGALDGRDIDPFIAACMSE